MINAKELRIGNLVEYKITDEFDKRKEWWEVSEIDADDIHWLSKFDTKDEDFRAIPLTEEWLLKLGFKKERERYFNNFIVLRFINNKVDVFNLGVSHDDEYLEFLNSINYVHQLQNLHFALTHRELTVA